MSDNTRFDDRRSAAWREAIIEEARADRSRASSTRKRLALIVGLVLAALVVSGGGVAYALSTNAFRPASAPVTTATPIERDTPSVTAAPTPAAPTSSPAQDPAATARGMAQQACRELASALDGDGNIQGPDSWAQALANARETAEAAAGVDPRQAGFASHVDALAKTPLPGPTASDSEKNAYSGAYLPVAEDCSALDVRLPTD